MSQPPIPSRALLLVALYGLALPSIAYLALAILDARTVGLLLAVVATMYLVTAVVMVIEAAAAAGRRRRPRDAAPPAAGDLPRVSVLVVAYLPNEQDIILDTIRHILRTLDVPADRLQVVLAYNRPVRLAVEDELEEMAANDSRFVPLHVRGSHSKAENINAALTVLTGDVVAVFDADHQPAPDSVRRAVGWLQAGYDVVQGRCVIRNHDRNWLTGLVALEFGSMYAVAHAARSVLSDLAIFGGSNGYWRTAVLRQVEMDASMMTEDIDATLRSLRHGYRIVHDRSITSSELAPDTIRSWIHQRIRWAQGWHQVSRRHGRAVGRDPSLAPAQRLYLAYLLPWRELHAVVAPQALPLLLAIVAVQWVFGGRWVWDAYLTGTTLLTLYSGLFVTAVAALHESMVRPVRCRTVLGYLALAPVIAAVRSAITLVAWLREGQSQRDWIVTRRSASRSAPEGPTGLVSRSGTDASATFRRDGLGIPAERDAA